MLRKNVVRIQPRPEVFEEIAKAVLESPTFGGQVRAYSDYLGAVYRVHGEMWVPLGEARLEAFIEKAAEAMEYELGLLAGAYCPSQHFN